MTAPSRPYRPSRSDRIGIWGFIVAGVVIAIGTAVAATARIAEIAATGPVPVPVQFAGAPGNLDAAAGGLAVRVDLATIQVTEMPLASRIAGVAGPAISALVTATVIACLIVLAVSVIRGAIFSRRNTLLVGTAGAVGLVGTAAAELCRTMLANGALAWASERRLENVVFSVAPGPYVVAAFVIALACTVFVVGERIQRETEGLV